MVYNGRVTAAEQRARINAVKRAHRDLQKAEKQVATARAGLRSALVTARAETDLTDEEIARVWGKSRQSLHKFIGPEKARVKTDA